jgi:hypothetical protein
VAEIPSIPSAYVARVVVSNPLKTKAIAESTVKTDKVYSQTLAQSLRVGFLPEVWHPSGPFQLLRQLTVFYARSHHQAVHPPQPRLQEER